MIPKILHYVWVGNKPKPQSVVNCIKSWETFHPDYQIFEWNEDNFDINENRYCRESYTEKKWAFVSDYIRLKVLYTYGGIYMDTDVEVCRSFDDLLKYSFFACLEYDKISLGTFGCVCGNEYVGELLDSYKDRSFYKRDGNIDTTTNLIIATNIARKRYGLSLNQHKGIIFDSNNIIFPSDYFIAKDYFTGKINKTNNTYAIHHYDGTWVESYKRTTILEIGSYKFVKFHKKKNAKNNILPIRENEIIIKDYVVNFFKEKYIIMVIKTRRTHS